MRAEEEVCPPPTWGSSNDVRRGGRSAREKFGGSNCRPKGVFLHKKLSPRGSGEKQSGLLGCAKAPFAGSPRSLWGEPPLGGALVSRVGAKIKIALELCPDPLCPGGDPNSPVGCAKPGWPLGGFIGTRFVFSPGWKGSSSLCPELGPLRGPGLRSFRDRATLRQPALLTGLFGDR